MNRTCILALDQGTTSSRAIVVDRECRIKAISQKGFRQFFPHAGWVEHDPNEIWASQSGVAAEALAAADLTAADIAAIGITNQRETTIIWDRKTSSPIYNAIVWQDRRTADYCERLKTDGLEKMIRDKTGLVIDAYFSATKIKWILDNVPHARERAMRGELCFGNIDSWLVWKFTRGKTHITDVTNASRTMLFNIHTLKWDDDLLRLFDIPPSILPDVRSSSEHYTDTAPSFLSGRIPIAGIAGDQQAALFGQLCTQPGTAKTTYGTGCFVMMNAGDTPAISHNGLLSTVAWQIGGRVAYALEGSVFAGGATIQWLRDGIGILRNASESKTLALSVPDSGGVCFVPALTGLGAPYWDPYARGTLFGITRGTGIAHIARAALEAIAYQVYDVIRAMENEMGTPLQELRVDGGASANDFLMQFQADLNRTRVVRPENMESTVLGAAFLAGLATGYWKDEQEIANGRLIGRSFEPQGDPDTIQHGIDRWHEAVRRSQGWAEQE